MHLIDWISQTKLVIVPALWQTLVWLFSQLLDKLKTYPRFSFLFCKQYIYNHRYLFIYHLYLHWKPITATREMCYGKSSNYRVDWSCEQWCKEKKGKGGKRRKGGWKPPSTFEDHHRYLYCCFDTYDISDDVGSSAFFSLLYIFVSPIKYVINKRLP